jgi:hypothetical protein
MVGESVSITIPRDIAILVCDIIRNLDYGICIKYPSPSWDYDTIKMVERFLEDALDGKQ